MYGISDQCKTVRFFGPTTTGISFFVMKNRMNVHLQHEQNGTLFTCVRGQEEGGLEGGVPMVWMPRICMYQS
jgi:hypothetical protein